MKSSRRQDKLQEPTETLRCSERLLFGSKLLSLHTVSGLKSTCEALPPHSHCA